jgi:hypothetical protein
MKISKALLVTGVTASLAWSGVQAEEAPVPELSAPSIAASTPTLNTQSLFTRYSPFRLFDPSRLQFHSSYSLSYFSGSAGSANVGVYTSSIGYQISNPLYMQLDLGIVHEPGALFSGDGRQLDPQVRPNLYLRYAPSPKFSLIVDVRTMPLGLYHPTGGWGYWPR